jgi:hypothetical protein
LLEVLGLALVCFQYNTAQAVGVKVAGGEVVAGRQVQRLYLLEVGDNLVGLALGDNLGDGGAGGVAFLSYQS